MYLFNVHGLETPNSSKWLKSPAFQLDVNIPRAQQLDVVTSSHKTYNTVLL